MEAYISAEHKRGRQMLELYELVQHAGNVLPRLYLLLTVGSVYIVSKESILHTCRTLCVRTAHLALYSVLRMHLARALPPAGP